MREFRIQLKDRFLGAGIITAGGCVHVATAGSPDKATLFDKTGASLANPITPTRGFINFFVADSVASVDLYIQAPGGQFMVVTGQVASGPNEIAVDTQVKTQLYQIPFSVTNQGGDATETDSGFDLPANALILDRLHGCGLNVSTLEAGKTLDFGLGEVHPAESGGDANGLIAASSVAAVGLVIGTNGALFSSNAPHKANAVTAKSLTWTLSTGAVAAKGFINVPVRLG